MKAIKATDYGNFFADRYTITFDTGDEYGMSYDANMPNGVCMYEGNINDEDYMLNKNSSGIFGKEISLDDLPNGVKKQIKYLETVE